MPETMIGSSMIVNLQSEWNEMFRSVTGKLILDENFVNNAFDSIGASTDEIDPAIVVDTLFVEAKKTFRMIEPFLKSGMKVLEIGGGVGITYAFLKSLGVDAVSLEPGSQGFGQRHRAGLQLIKLMGIDSGGWLKSGIEDFSTENQFDLIFSHFVLEHIPALDRAFQVMGNVLRKGGVMIHRCPNYMVPFEPHFNIPLLPFFPERTTCLFPALKKSSLWKGLNFTTASEIKRLCTRHGLKVQFRKGMVAWAFEQMSCDLRFAERKKGFGTLARMLEKTGTKNLLKGIPAFLATPMEFVIRKMDSKELNIAGWIQ